jgi:hypothetical protein
MQSGKQTAKRTGRQAGNLEGGQATGSQTDWQPERKEDRQIRVRTTYRLLFFNAKHRIVMNCGQILTQKGF